MEQMKTYKIIIIIKQQKTTNMKKLLKSYVNYRLRCCFEAGGFGVLGTFNNTIKTTTKKQPQFIRITKKRSLRKKITNHKCKD